MSEFPTSRVTIDINADDKFLAPIFAKQNDAGRKIQITLTSNAEPLEENAATSAQFRATKPDKTTVISEATIETDGTVTIEILPQTLALPGTVTAELALYNAESLITTAVFYIRVQASAIDDDAVVSTDEFSALTSATMDAAAATGTALAAAGAANAAADAAVEAAENADTATEAANTAAGLANTAAETADTATGLANAATDAATTAAGLANDAADAANTAAETADTATGLANAATDAADTATGLANSAADAANTAAGLADAATSAALDAAEAANEAAEIADTKQDKYIPTNTTGSLPIYSDAGKTIKCTPSSAGEIITSNGNLAGVFRIPDGELVVDTCTVTTSAGNHIKVLGTTAGNRYVRLSEVLQLGLSTVTARTFEFPLPLNQSGFRFYCYNVTKKTSPNSSIAVRSKTSGNAFTMQIATDAPAAQNFLPTSDFGALYMYLPTGTYDLEFDFVLSLDSETSYTFAPETEIITAPNTNDLYILSKGVLAATVATNYTEVISVQNEITQYYTDYDVDSWHNNTKIKVLRRDIKNTTDDRIFNDYYIFLPTSTVSNYATWQIRRVAQGGADNYDLWRTRELRMRVEPNIYKPSGLVTSGEIDMAVQIKNAPDFIGGVFHGDEIIVSASAYADGMPIDIGAFGEFECHEFRLLQTTTMYHPSDHTTVVGLHRKLWIFTRDKMVIENAIEWSANLTMMASYMAMLPVLRYHQSAQKQWSDRCMDDRNYEVYDVTNDVGGPAYPRTLKTGVNWQRVWGTTSGVSAEVKFTATPNLSSRVAFISSQTAAYNKIYFDFCGDDYSVTSGDIWRTRAEYIIDYTPPTI